MEKNLPAVKKPKKKRIQRVINNDELKLIKERFVEALSITGNVTESAKFANISRRQIYTYKDKDPDFAKEWDHAIEKGADSLEEEAKRRAVEGVEEPVFYRGQVVGSVRKYSDTLLMFLLNGLRPEKFKRPEKRQIDGNITFRWKRDDDGDSNPVPAS